MLTLNSLCSLCSCTEDNFCDKFDTSSIAWPLHTGKELDLADHFADASAAKFSESGGLVEAPGQAGSQSCSRHLQILSLRHL